MDLITEFIGRYRKEFDYYDQACRMVAQMLESNLRSDGVRAIVTSRAKSPDRLEAKVRQRNIEKKYANVDDIYEDIVDLAGVRVALYFPAEREKAEKIVSNRFALVANYKSFPESSKPTYKKRFSGYWATHYRVRIPETDLPESQKRYSDAVIEIQVASVLMHAWSEVEHDLVYKPLGGTLSDDEYAILDELNGLVLAGEIALERLQRAGELRASTKGRDFSNHYDLAAALSELARVNLQEANVNDAAIGRVDVLFELLKSLGLNKSDVLNRYVNELHTDFERRPLSEQIIDQILVGDTSRYEIYDRLRHSATYNNESETPDTSHGDRRKAVFNFTQGWIELETLIGDRFKANGVTLKGIMSPNYLKRLQMPEDVIASVERVRSFRNKLLHSRELPDVESIESATAELQKLLKRFR